MGYWKSQIVWGSIVWLRFIGIIFFSLWNLWGSRFCDIFAWRAKSSDICEMYHNVGSVFDFAPSEIYRVFYICWNKATSTHFFLIDFILSLFRLLLRNSYHLVYLIKYCENMPWIKLKSNGQLTRLTWSSTRCLTLGSRATISPLLYWR